MIKIKIKIHKKFKFKLSEKENMLHNKMLIRLYVDQNFYEIETAHNRHSLDFKMIIIS